MATSKRTPSPAFQFYPKDFFSSSKVLRMSNAECGIYIKLLGHDWLDNGLPTDLAALAKLANEPLKQFTRLWHGPLSECFVEKNGRLFNRRLEKERRAQAEYRRKQSERAAKRWDSHGNAVALPDAQPYVQSRNDALQSPSPSPSADRKEEREKNARAPGARVGLLKPPRPEAAFDGGKVWVLHKTHRDFLALRCDNEKELLDWYVQVAEEWNFGARKSEEPGANMFKFWEARYAERWPAMSKPDPFEAGRAERLAKWDAIAKASAK